MEIWGGIECTINRVGEVYYDQLDYQGHYDRIADIDLIADLGIRKLRYPVLWEKHRSAEFHPADFSSIDRHLNRCRERGISVIAGLVHHGSGPVYVNILEDSFADGLAVYAAEVAARYPWINDYTPINEPLTTARFTGLYGLWFPHLQEENAFFRILINECKATVLAMQAIRKINPTARLIHTEDLGKTHSTTLLQYQADFENSRRWIGMDLLCGKLDGAHPFWNYLLDHGIAIQELRFFLDNATPPDVLGFNHYITSERYLDENLDKYPWHTHGGNSIHRYADVEAIRTGDIAVTGIKNLLKEAWDRFNLPMAVTEAHLHCGREDQLRWFKHIVDAAQGLVNEGVALIAVTAWSFFGAYGWNHLLTHQDGSYESGVYDLSEGMPRETALAGMIRSFVNKNNNFHPVSGGEGWWSRPERLIYGKPVCATVKLTRTDYTTPLLIIADPAELSQHLIAACNHRDIQFVVLGLSELDLDDPIQLNEALELYRPWSVINTTGSWSGNEEAAATGSAYPVWDLVNKSLDMLIDYPQSIWHLRTSEPFLMEQVPGHNKESRLLRAV